MSSSAGRVLPTVYDRARPRVLVVEDDPLIRRMLERMLATLGCVVLSAGSGAGAREIAHRQPRLALGIVDLSLPDDDGVSLVSALREILRPTPPPFVTFSGHEPLDPLPAGVVASLTKPMRMADLVAAVKTVLAPGRRGDPIEPPAEAPLVPVADRVRRAITTLHGAGRGLRTTLRDRPRER